MNARIPLALAAIALCVTACGKSEQQKAAESAAATPAPTPANTTATAAPAPANSTATAAAAKPNDAQIAHIVVTANSIDSTAGELAKKNGSAKAVKDFGQTMVTDHSASNKQATALAKKLNVTPEDNDVSKQLKSGADQNMANLQGKSGAAFDSAYINNEVAYHQNVLDAIDKTLIPSAQNAELKALLEKTRPVVAAHLDRAKKIQGSLGKKM
jgi:putative membrane protein